MRPLRALTRYVSRYQRGTFAASIVGLGRRRYVNEFPYHDTYDSGVAPVHQHAHH
ncbi:hypothetical protein [Microbispora sp. NPDC049125]|uniref:hypothetical protein n=1 Tax=Microbispora sp. NPDC049125 TaxID=3154929 RepID=UPI003467745B